MKTHNLVQGSPEWLAYRAQHFNASDAPAMMGESAYKTRTQLLHEISTGLVPDVDAGTQRLFDDGHRFEALARPLAELVIGMDLYPVTGSNGKLSASFDGLTMDDTIIFEHKTLNSELRAAFDMIKTIAPDYRDQAGGAELPLMYRIQMEQQLLVSGAERCLFMASKWQGDELTEECHAWYHPDPDLRSTILQGWTQFEIDLAAYVPIEVLDKTIVVTRRPDQLPAIHSSVKGELVLESNIKEWESAALAYIKGVSEHELKTDEDFENANEATKWCVSSKTALQGVRANLMGATGDVNVAVGTIDRIMAELDKTRLAFANQIDARKAARKVELLSEHKTLLADHLRNLNTRLGRDYMPEVPADFSGAIHGKRNFASMSAALNATLANSKIAANAIADKIDANLKVLSAHEEDYKFLFNDVEQLVIMNNDHLVMLVDKRINDHKAAEAKKADDLRESIRKEEQDKLAKEQADKSAADLKAAEAAKLVTHEAVVEIMMPTTVVEAMKPATDMVRFGSIEIPRDQIEKTWPTKAKPVTPPELKLGQISARLGFTLTATFLSDLGFEPAATDKAAKLYHESSFPLICKALVQHINDVCMLQAA